LFVVVRFVERQAGGGGRNNNKISIAKKERNNNENQPASVRHGSTGCASMKSGRRKEPQSATMAEQ